MVFEPESYADTAPARTISKQGIRRFDTAQLPPCAHVTAAKQLSVRSVGRCELGALVGLAGRLGEPLCCMGYIQYTIERNFAMYEELENSDIVGITVQKVGHDPRSQISRANLCGILQPCPSPVTEGGMTHRHVVAYSPLIDA